MSDNGFVRFFVGIFAISATTYCAYKILYFIFDPFDDSAIEGISLIIGLLTVVYVSAMGADDKEKEIRQEIQAEKFLEQEQFREIQNTKAKRKLKKFKKGDLITSEYDLEDANGKIYKGIGKILGIVKKQELKGKRKLNIEYYEIKFGRKKLSLKVSEQRMYKLKKYQG